MTSQLMTYEDVARECQVSLGAVKKWAASKQLKVLRLGHRIRRVKREELDAFLRRRIAR
mgnify:CR=1 FL=1